MHRREFVAALGTAAGAATAGCSDLPPPLGDPAVTFPAEPPEAAIRTVREHVLALGRGDYVAACRDRCLLVLEDGQQKLDGAERMSEADLREWAREARNWYGSADFAARSVEVTGSEKMDPGRVDAAGYGAGYYLTVSYEGTGRIANPFEEQVVEDDGDWWVLVGTF